MLKDNYTLLLIIGFIIFFYMFIMPYFENKHINPTINPTTNPSNIIIEPSTNSNTNINPTTNPSNIIIEPSSNPTTNIEKLDNIFDSFNEIENFDDTKIDMNDNSYIPKIDMNKCDKSCCRHSQWMPSYMTLNPDKKYIGSNYSCNRGEGSGCLCVTQNDLDFLTKRGYS